MINIMDVFSKFKNRNNNYKQYNINMQKKCRNLLNTNDGKEVMEWLIQSYLLITSKVTDKDMLLYNQGSIDLIKRLMVISMYTDDEFLKLENSNV